jgi:predicted NAD/FAD-binding protein/cytochrome b involved in lipid metabolism
MRRTLVFLGQRVTTRTATMTRRQWAYLIGGAVGASCLAVPSLAFASDKSSPVAGKKSPITAPAATGATTKVYRLDDVRRHNTEDSIWVTYEGKVYDVTGFLNTHPGGKGLLMTAAGLDLSHFFGNYKVHTKTTKAQDYLDGMQIGILDPQDHARAVATTTPAVHVEHRLALLAASRRRMVLILITIPFWLLVRFAIRAISFINKQAADAFAKQLPVSVPGCGAASRLEPKDPATGKKRRVAVVGGGIAGSGAAYALQRSGFDVTLYEARAQTSGNAHTFDWDVHGQKVKTCVSVTAWPPILYKNYVALLKQLDVKTVPQTLSWFLNSKVPGHEGTLWAASAEAPEGSLRKHFAKDFDAYGKALKLIKNVTEVMSFQVGKEPSMYSIQGGLGVLNPFTTLPLHTVCRWFGVSQAWWDIVFTPHYTASFLTDKLDNMVAVTGHMIEQNIPLLPDEFNTKNNVVTTCETWADAGKGLREVFTKLHKGVAVKENTRVLKVDTDEKDGQIHVRDEHGNSDTFDRVIFACPCNAVGNMLERHNWIEETVLSVPEYADDHHPATGHMHAVMHNDSGIIPSPIRNEILSKASNYVEISTLKDGSINIENTYNFGVQTPSLVKKSLNEKPPLLITHALGEGKSIDSKLVRGEGNHARAHPLYSGWNLTTVLTMRLLQGRRGVFYCANYTTPGNCHDMSLLSGLIAAHAVGADYPFPDNVEAFKDFGRLRGLMGV